MALNASTLDQLADLLENCQLQAKDTLKITDTHPNMDWDDAYAIQDRILARKLARGARVVGYKAGLTSHAKMKQMGVTDPVFGFLVDEFVVPEGAEIKVSDLIHPKVEPEICFITRTELKGPGCHIGAVLAASDVVLPGIEVIDSRYRDFKFDLVSVCADNSSSSRFVTGGRRMPVDATDLTTLGVVMEKNGEIVEMSTGAAVLGNPAASVAMLANMLGERGEEIPAGTFIMTGGVTAAVAVAAGDVINVRYHELGSLSMRFV